MLNNLNGDSSLPSNFRQFQRLFHSIIPFSLDFSAFAQNIECLAKIHATKTPVPLVQGIDLYWYGPWLAGIAGIGQGQVHSIMNGMYYIYWHIVVSVFPDVGILRVICRRCQNVTIRSHERLGDGINIGPSECVDVQYIDRESDPYATFIFRYGPIGKSALEHLCKAH